MKKRTWSTYMLATAAVCIAMSFLLSYVKIFSMPVGGSVTVLSMLPIMVFAWVYGVVPGLIAGAALGVLQFIQEPFAYHFIQVLLDYPLAFAMLGLAGIFRNVQKPWALPAGVVIGCFGRFLCHLISGMVFFSSMTSITDFFPTLVSSAIYNGGYMAVEAVLTGVVAALPPVQHMLARLRKMIPASRTA